MTLRGFVTAELVVTGLGFLTFIISYARVTWNRNREGRFIMALAVSMVTVIGLWVAGRSLGGLSQHLLAVAFGALAIVAWWLPVLFWRRQREQK